MSKYSIIFASNYYFTQTIDTTILYNHPSTVITLNVTLEPDPNRPKPAFIPEPEKPFEEFEKINLAAIPVTTSIDSSMMVTDVNVSDVSDKNIDDADILYYTVQVIALHNPVDASYFKRIDDLKILFNEDDKFYRYTTGRFNTREEAYAWRLELIRRGYPEEIFIKKVSK